ncbi:MAG TPA: hypothetical protein VMT52_08480 [Planctomycetota bacterium]|nr:hypothetical protein [Planctomycetota bacterium]
MQSDERRTMILDAAPERPWAPAEERKVQKGLVRRFVHRALNKGKLAFRLYQAHFANPSHLDRVLGRKLRKHRGPILVGPWVSEVGFELLYWIPFLRHCMTRYRVDPSRVTVVSRGGAEGWYSGLAASYVDVFDLLSPEEFLEGNREREWLHRGKKQFSVSPFEARILEQAAAKAGLDGTEFFHPSLMYSYYRPFWSGLGDPGPVLGRSQPALIGHAYERVPGLPFDGDYIAFKSYFSACFPETDDNAQFVSSLIDKLAARSNVVLLNTGLRLDDHTEFGRAVGGRVFDASGLMTPRNNLEIQSAIVAHSRGLVSTYGGFSYLGPLLARRSLGFYSTTEFVTTHLAIATETLNGVGSGTFSAVPTRGMDLLLGMD